VTGLLPITITTAGVYITPTSLSVVLPDYSSMALPSGYSPITSTSSYAYGMRFNVLGTGLLSTPLRIDYPSANPIRFKLYYDDADLVPLGISKSALALMGFNGSSWQVISNAAVDSTSGTKNSYTVDAPLSADAYVAYGIFYSTPSSGPGALPTPTAVTYANTKAFNPRHSNSVFRKARFYYSDQAPKDVEARIFDTSGALIRSLTLGSGINAGDVRVDATYGTAAYYFEWDGRNDSGTLVRNGLYLVRWRVTKTDGSSDTQVKPVALIK
jgi:hypothetical protein